MSFIDDVEDAAQSGHFRKNDKNKSNVLSMLFANLSAGKNNEELARLLSAWGLIISIFGWEDKPLAKLVEFVTHYQASIDGSYHKDLKDVLIAEEIVKRQSERKGISILQQR